MKAHSFDHVARRLAEGRLSRRQALARGAAGLVTGSLAGSGMRTAAQDATPVGEATASERAMFLFVQSFHQGTVQPVEGQADRYTVSLEHGLGQTIYFSDRPDRIVGAAPTRQFLDGLGFDDDNPPNAALVVERSPGETDIAIVELFTPVFDEARPDMTYDVEVLANWEHSVELGFHEAPKDLAAMEPTFGAVHLFIDDCAVTEILCRMPPFYASLGYRPTCWSHTLLQCIACQNHESECNARFPDFCHEQFCECETRTGANCSFADIEFM